MNPGRAIKRIVIRKAVDETFKNIEKHPVLTGKNEISLDVFNSGIVINLSRTARKYYPHIAEMVRAFVENELRKM